MTDISKKISCAIIIVTHNSELHLKKNLHCLMAQTRSANQIIIIDSGSKDIEYLSDIKHLPNVQVVLTGEDIGFCRGNNAGMRLVDPHCEHVLFLNPDAFLPPTFLEMATQVMEKPENGHVGMLTGSLLGYDMTNDRPTGRYDSTGIFRTWYGRFYDRDQGNSCTSIVRQGPECVPAICGALMFCRMNALRQVLLNDSDVFDNAFFMYKEDIDLSLRLQDKGWRLLLEPTLTAYHCRGWNRNRKKVSRTFRLMSAKNDLKINLKRRSIYALYSSLTYLAVRLFNA